MEDYKEKYEKLHKKTLAALQQRVSEGKITEETARSICADFVKESRDEKIRKAVKEAVEYYWSDDTQARTDILAWLEKQGEQEHVVVVPRFRVGDDIRPKGSMAEYTIESIYGECYHGKGWGLHISCDDDYELVKQKCVWSEEDEKHYQGCLNLMKLSLDTKPYPYYNDYLWLKSLKARYTWKPSDEQIRPLGYAIDYFKKKKNDTTYLESLYKDLKKLVEE